MEGACWPWDLSNDGGDFCAGGSGLVGGPAQASGFSCFSPPHEMQLQLLPPLKGMQFYIFPSSTLIRLQVGAS